jgi:GNAT superfamily N-acetyltransferase
MSGVQMRVASGVEIRPVLAAVADLRIAVFREFPYLYEGDRDYEREYLKVYAASEKSVIVLALDGDRVVGVATGLPLLDSEADFRKPFEEAGYPLAEVFYFGESVLSPEYRGRGIGKAFFEGRESHARRLGYRWTTFCAVERPPDDPRRPVDYRPLDGFWLARGYVFHPELSAVLPWKEVGGGERKNTLRFWLRDWSRKV